MRSRSTTRSTTAAPCEGTNYTVVQASGTLTFAPGASTATVTVTGKDDGVYLGGAGKTFTFALSSPQGATISGSSSSTGTINDTDTAPLLGISTCGSGSVNGGAMAVFPIRVQGASVPASVDYTTVPGTTIAGDYDGSSGTITIPAGSSIRQFDLKIPTHSIAPPAPARSASSCRMCTARGSPRVPSRARSRVQAAEAARRSRQSRSRTRLPWSSRRAARRT